MRGASAPAQSATSVRGLNQKTAKPQARRRVRAGKQHLALRDSRCDGEGLHRLRDQRRQGERRDRQLDRVRRYGMVGIAVLLAQHGIVLLLRHAHFGAVRRHLRGVGHLFHGAKVRRQRRLLEQQAGDHQEGGLQAAASAAGHIRGIILFCRRPSRGRAPPPRQTFGSHLDSPPSASPMTFTVEPNFLRGILDALRKPRRNARMSSAMWLINQVVHCGWMYRPDVEDLLVALDSRLADFGAIDVDRWVNLFGLRWSSVCTRPKAKSTGTVAFDALRDVEVAELLIQLERCGFHTEPQHLVDPLRKQVSTKPMLTGAELTVLWFDSTRHKCEPISLTAPGSLAGMLPIERIKLETGHKVEVWGKDAESVQGLIITAPKFRHRKAPVEATCPECLFTYYRGDRGSTALHRAEHKKRMTYLDPQPHPKLLAARATDPDADVVTTRSPAWKHREMYVRARAFKRELHYDFIQWGSPRGDDDPHVHGILFAAEDGIIVGACSFRWREVDDHPPFWGLQWIWICPKHRRQGHLERYWPKLRARFGAFVIEAPVSDAMRAFATKHGDAALLEWRPKVCSSATT